MFNKTLKARIRSLEEIVVTQANAITLISEDHGIFARAILKLGVADTEIRNSIAGIGRFLATSSLIVDEHERRKALDGVSRLEMQCDKLCVLWAQMEQQLNNILSRRLPPDVKPPGSPT